MGICVRNFADALQKSVFERIFMWITFVFLLNSLVCGGFQVVLYYARILLYVV